MLRRNFANGKQISLYIIRNKHDHSHALKSTVYINYTCKNSLNLLLKYLTKKNSFTDIKTVGSTFYWFYILHYLQFFCLIGLTKSN